MMRRRFLLSSGTCGMVALVLAMQLGAGTSRIYAQNSTGQIDCSDPVLGSSAACLGLQGGQNRSGGGAALSSGMSTPANAGNNQRGTDNQQVYVDSAGLDARPRNVAPGGVGELFPPDKITDFQRLARSSTGELLPVFGRDLFQRAPSTFAPADQIPVTSDYVVGPGDEVLVRLWGPETFNSQLTVDTTGSIYIPKVGAIHVAGLRSDELQEHISSEANRIYRNYRISVSLGHLRSIQIYVVGEARRPGAFTISALSTVLNALFVSGGPNVEGSLRHIQVRRAGQTLPEFDLYDLVLHGDKSKDVRLESGDTIFIPPVGAQVALSGSVRHPAIYEVKPDSTVQDILNLAGGFSAVGVPGQIKLERIDANRSRQAMSVALNADGRAIVLRDGDVLYTDHISAGYERSVTIRGNLANPGRFAWHEGMRLSDILPDRMSLLTNNYWRERNGLGVPVPLFEPMGRSDSVYRQNEPVSNGMALRGTEPVGLPNTSQEAVRPGSPGAMEQGNASTIPLAVATVAEGNDQPGLFGSWNGTNNVAANGTAQPSYGQAGAFPASSGTPTPQTQPFEASRQTPPRNRIQIPAPEINWSYAVIERLDPDTLKNSLVPFNLGRLVQDHDRSQDLELRPGDIVTILSQNDVPVPLDAQTKYVRLEGEFGSSGVYSVLAGETLDDLVRRAGGFSPKAYLYGSSFQRESARVFQQQRLDEYISTLSADMERAAAVRAASSSSGVLDPNALAEQRTLVAQLRQMRATGRVVLEFQPDSVGVEGVPRIPLENGDVFRVPSRPNTVSVLGAVYGQNVFLYNAARKLDDYLELAGKPNRIADRKHAFIIRADGSIFSRERAQGVISNHFDNARINPGDSIVIPEKLIKPTLLRQALDYSQILSSFGLAAAAINVVR